MLKKLREETSDLHKEIEKDNLAELILSHEITLEEYKLLLLQNYTAYAITEAEIARFLEGAGTEKSDRLERDLKNLNVDYSLAEGDKEAFKISNRAEALGAAYVVEGSALGGMMISKEIKNCPSLAEIEIHHFFNGDRKSVNGWKKFCKLLKEENFTALEEEQAIIKAKATFQFFGKIFSRVQTL